jgi:uncharacterized cofD-like protein
VLAGTDPTVSAARRWRTVASWRRWLAPGMGVKRHVAWAVLGALIALAGVSTSVVWGLGEGRRDLAAPIEEVLVSEGWSRLGGWLGGAVALVGIVVAVAAIGRLNRSLLSNWMPRPHEAAEVLYRRLVLARGPKVVALGGGTGLSLLLRGLRAHTSQVTAVVAVSDDGGSTGRLRAAFGMPAPGDLTDCLAALAADEAALGRLLQYRFERGGELRGHTFGNVLIATLHEVEHDFGDALRSLNRLLELQGAVWPATPQPVTLRVTKADGRVVDGESAVRAVTGASARLEVLPAHAAAMPEAVASIAAADLVVLGPGSLFTSTLPPLMVDGVAEALRATPARLVYVANLMTEAGETDGFDLGDHLEAIRAHLGRLPDVVLGNLTAIDAERLAAYAEEGARPVPFERHRVEALGAATVAAPLLGSGRHAQHDPAALAAALVAIAPRRGSAR